MFLILKWFSTICYVFGTIILLSPVIASEAITPWAMFLMGNSILFVEYSKKQQWPLVWLSIFFFVWDMLIIYSRVTHLYLFDWIMPYVQLLEKVIP